jgi:hypothetical protein
MKGAFVGVVHEKCNPIKVHGINNVKMLIYNPSQTELQKYSIRIGQNTGKSASLSHSYTHTHARAHTHTYTRARARTHTHTHTHTKEQIK